MKVIYQSEANTWLLTRRMDICEMEMRLEETSGNGQAGRQGGRESGIMFVIIRSSDCDETAREMRVRVI